MYCQPSDIRDAVSGTDAGTGTCAQLEDFQLSEAIGRASTKVSAYTGTSYTVDANDPVAVIPDLVAGITVQLAVFYATLTYRKGKSLDQYDPVMLGYTDAMATLKDIVNGNIEVAPVAPNDPVESPGHVINTIPRTFRLEDSGVERDGRGGITAAGAPGSLLRDGWQ
jgi:phage gp36-like protein